MRKPTPYNKTEKNWKRAKKGTLYLIPAPIAAEQKTFLLPVGYAQIRELRNFIVETPKTARAVLAKLNLKTEISKLELSVLDEHTKYHELPALLKPLLEGSDVGLLSDAGLPGIADPGAKLIKLAHENKIRVKPHVGPSSIFLALMASGLNGQSFVFEGYLPVEKERRIKKVKSIENLSFKFHKSHIFIEAPYRNQYLFDDILATCADETLLCIAVGVSGREESIQTMRVGDWKRLSVKLKQTPTVFILEGRI